MTTASVKAISVLMGLAQRGNLQLPGVDATAYLAHGMRCIDAAAATTDAPGKVLHGVLMQNDAVLGGLLGCDARKPLNRVMHRTSHIITGARFRGFKMVRNCLDLRCVFHPQATRANSSISAMPPPCYSLLEEIVILGVIYGSLVWWVCNPAAPAGPRGIPGLSPGNRCWVEKHVSQNKQAIPFHTCV